MYLNIWKRCLSLRLKARQESRETASVQVGGAPEPRVVDPTRCIAPAAAIGAKNRVVTRRFLMHHAPGSVCRDASRTPPEERGFYQAVPQTPSTVFRTRPTGFSDARPVRRAKGAIRRADLHHKFDFLQLSPPFLLRFHELPQNNDILCIFLLNYSFLRHIESQTGTRTPRSKRPRPPSRKQAAQDRKAHRPDASHDRSQQGGRARPAPCDRRSQRAAPRPVASAKNSACAQERATRCPEPKAEKPRAMRAPRRTTPRSICLRARESPARTTADPSQRSIPSRIVPGIMLLFRSHNPRAGTQAPCCARLMEHRRPADRRAAPQNANGRKSASSGIEGR